MPKNPNPIMTDGFRSRIGKGQPLKPNKQQVTLRLSKDSIVYLDSLKENRGDAIDRLIAEEVRRQTE